MQKLFGYCQLYYFWVRCQYVVPTGASLTVLMMELSMLVVTLEATAKNSSRLKHCIEVCDTTHNCLSCGCNTVHFFFMLKEGH
jgi:hypothetical protein